MVNTTDEITIIDAEIEKTEKAIRKALEVYNEVYREASDHFTRYNAIPSDPSGAYKESKKLLVDAMLGGGKELDAHRHTIKNLQSRLDTLKQSREVKLNKIVFKEDLEEVEKQRNEVEELKRRRAELIAKYANPETQSKTQETTSTTRDKPAGATVNPTGQATPGARNTVSFDDVNLIVTIDAKEYPFEETIKKQRKKKLTEAYKLFELLYKNQHRRIKKGEITKLLKFGASEQRVFNAKSKAGKVIKSSPYSITTEKEYGDKGGYLLVLKKTDLESS